jgi:hypothetical protein
VLPGCSAGSVSIRWQGPESPEVAARVRRLFMIFRFDTALLVLIVLNMVVKPS